LRNVSLEQLAAEIPDGATVGIGGVGLERKPMAAARALVAAGRRDLRLVSFLGSLDVELLIAAGCVSELHSAGVSLERAGLAPHYRAGRQQQGFRFVEWSEGTLICALETSARGVPSLPTWLALDTDLPAINPYLREARDPFTGERVMQVRALELDAAILHVPAVDSRGNAYVEGDFGVDGLLARAAGHVYVCHEETLEADPRTAVLSRIWVSSLVHAQHGAWPTGCHPAYRVDRPVVERWARTRTDADLQLLMSERGSQ
jgi:glutaconate CoA-transferase, subunit A